MTNRGMLLAVLLPLLLACGSEPRQRAVDAVAASHSPDLIARGEYLVTVLGCNDCHTPFQMGPRGPEPDMTRMLSGHPESLVMPPPPVLPEGPWLWTGSATNTAFAGPWGVSYSANLTPDASGLAAWDERIFIQAIRTGKHWGVSREILPPMPWPWFAKLTDEDLRSIFAYLRSIPPIVNHVPDAVVAEQPGGPAPSAVPAG